MPHFLRDGKLADELLFKDSFPFARAWNVKTQSETGSAFQNFSMCSLLCTSTKIEEGEFDSLLTEKLEQCLKGIYIEAWTEVGAGRHFTSQRILWIWSYHYIQHKATEHWNESWQVWRFESGEDNFRVWNL